MSRRPPRAPRGAGDWRNPSEPFGSMSARPIGLADIELNGLAFVRPFGSRFVEPFGSTGRVTGGEATILPTHKIGMMKILLASVSTPNHERAVAT